jgi:hypothetical protein
LVPGRNRGTGTGLRSRRRRWTHSGRDGGGRAPPAPTTTVRPAAREGHRQPFDAATAQATQRSCAAHRTGAGDRRRAGRPSGVSSGLSDDEPDHQPGEHTKAHVADCRPEREVLPQNHDGSSRLKFTTVANGAPPGLARHNRVTSRSICFCWSCEESAHRLTVVSRNAEN